jgi:mRNA interferase MazF
MERGEVWWADLPDPVGAGPGFRRPVIVIQSNDFNRSKIRTIIILILTSNLKLSDAPGNVLIPSSESGLSKDSVANISQIITVDKDFLTEKCGKLPLRYIKSIDDGLRLVLSIKN